MNTTAFAHGVEGIDYSSLLVMNTLQTAGSTTAFDPMDSSCVLPLYAAKPALDDEEEDEDEEVDDDEDDDDLEDDDLDDDDLDDEDDDLEDDDEEDEDDEDDEELEDDDDPKPLKVKSRG